MAARPTAGRFPFRGNRGFPAPGDEKTGLTLFAVARGWFIPHSAFLSKRRPPRPQAGLVGRRRFFFFWKEGLILNIDFDEAVRLVQRAKSILSDEALLAEASAKGRANFVTRCDTAVQDFLQRELRARWPQVQFLGEETDCDPDFSGSVWVLDPVDGTANLMHHFQHSAVSLALVEAGHSFSERALPKP